MKHTESLWVNHAIKSFGVSCLGNFDKDTKRVKPAPKETGFKPVKTKSVTIGGVY